MTTVPTTEPAIRIAKLFNRRLSTPWIERDVRAFRNIKGHFEDLGIIEKYYEAQRKLGDKGIHRRDLGTFLNNYFGEADRARAWEEQTNERKRVEQKRKEPLIANRSDWTPEEKERAAQIRAGLRDLAQKLRMPV